MLTFVSHELRQPLAAMGIWLNLLEAETVATLSAEAQDHIAQIRASVSWMTELISGRLAEELRNRASH
jgi:signal transduction histidine kinase